MRLIDADKLRHELIMGHDLIGAKYSDMAETVKAIPIEWLQKKLIEYVCSGKYGSDNLPIVYSLIADWRKGNE